MLIELDLVTPWVQGINYVLLLAVIVTYYVKAYRQPGKRKFFLPIALAWTMNLCANIAWMIRYSLTQEPVASVSFLDLFYVTSYVLIAWVLWTIPKPLPSRSWLWVGIALVVACAVIWATYDGYVRYHNRGDAMSFFLDSAYPILDAGLLSLAWHRYHQSRGTAHSKVSLLLACAVTAYFAANVVQLIGYIFTPVMGGFLQNFLWMTRHVIMLIIAFRFRRTSDLIST